MVRSMSKAGSSSQPLGGPWYRNAWVWLIIAIPGMTVAGCLFTIYLAIANPDERVRDPVEAAAEQAIP